MAVMSTVEANGRVAQPDPAKEYIGGGLNIPLLGGYGTLADHVQRVTELGGPALADLMMQDEAVAGAVLTICQGMLAQGMQITATVDLEDSEEIEDLTEADVQTAFRVEDHCQRCWRGLPSPHSLLWGLSRGAMVYRTVLSEVVKTVAESGPDEGLYVFDRIPVKEPGSWSFNLDAYGNVRGIHAHVVSPDSRYTTSSILERSKFVILAWDPIKGHPWGEGVLHRAYNAWNFKVQEFPLLWKYIQLFAIPTTHASPGESAKPRPLLDDSGQEIGDNVPAEVWLFNGLEKMTRAGSLLVTPHGTTLAFLEPPGNGAVFDMTLDLLDRMIAKAILQTGGLRNRDKRSGGTEAAAKAEVQSLVVSYGKAILRECLNRDLWKVHVEQNFGPEIARRFTPEVSFGLIDREDFSRTANAMSRLWGVGMLTEAERGPALRLMGLNFTRRSRKSDPMADLEQDPSKGRRPINVRRPAA